MMQIELINAEDFKQFWPVFKDIAESAETYAIDPAISYQQAYDYWCLLPQATYVAKQDGQVVASYYLKPNAAGPASHVCNCGYMVSASFRGHGIARELCLHSQRIARELGYRAMQFNLVVCSNQAAIHLWQSLDFSIIGTLPGAYHHRKLGYVDAHVMYKVLQAPS